MKKITNYIIGATLCIALTQCKKDYLSATSPSNVDDNFVTSTPSETFKTLSWCYANYRQNCIMGGYRWNEPVGSDAEMYPEESSSNNMNAILRSDLLPVNASSGGFNSLYTTLARAAKVAEIIAAKPTYQADAAAGKPTEWTHLYGEAMTMKALCYFDLVKHFGDVPYGYENKVVTDYSLTSRFAIYDSLIAELRNAEALMYKIGEGGITAERLSRTYCNALIGQLAMFSGGYQTIRTDVSGLYGSVNFTKKGGDAFDCVYARRTDYLEYYKIAEQYLQAAIDNKGTSGLITTDGRAFANNPFQRHFQYFADLQVSPESILEIGNIQAGQQATTSEYPYAFGRPSEGGSNNAAPAKVFAAIRIIPSFYYSEFENGDKRRDASVTVTGSTGTGNEMILSFKPGNKSTGGISTNKWDDNRMNPPYVTAQRNSGMNWTMLRMADVILMLAEAKAELGKAGEAITLVNQIRQRAFGNATRNISGLSGDALKEAILQERKLELVGEGTRRWDMIRSGKFVEKAIAIRTEMAKMISGLAANGAYKFDNGNVISNYIWTKMVQLTNPLTYDVTDSTNHALYPGWRGQYNYITIDAIKSKVTGTNHNLAIAGLFNNNIDTVDLKSKGYVKTRWAIDIVENAKSYDRNILSGIGSLNEPPRYYWPIPFETISKSKGRVTNGYGLPKS